MPPKKAPAKKAPAVKKAATTKKVAAVKNATPKRPAGVVKKTPSKTASAVKKAAGTPNSIRPRRLRTLTSVKKQSELPFSPSAEIYESWVVRQGNEKERAFEIFRLYGAAAVEACGYDQTVLMNACFNLAWNESARSIYPKTGERHIDGSLEARYGGCDENHKAEFGKWCNKMKEMENAMKELLVKNQTERQKAFFAVPFYPPGRTWHGTAKEEKERTEAKKLAVYYLEHPEEGNEIFREKATTKKTLVKKSAAQSATKLTPTPTPVKKTPVRKGSTVKKPATKSVTYPGLKKAKTSVKKSTNMPVKKSSKSKTSTKKAEAGTE